MVKFYVLICALVFALAYVLGVAFRPIDRRVTDAELLQNKDLFVALEKVEHVAERQEILKKTKSVVELLQNASRTPDAMEQRIFLQQAQVVIKKQSNEQSAALFKYLQDGGSRLDGLERARALVLAARVPVNRERVRSEALHDLTSAPVPVDRAPAEFRSLQDQHQARSESLEKNAALVTYDSLVDSAPAQELIDDTLQVLQSQKNLMVRKEIVYRLLESSADNATALYKREPGLWEEVFGARTYPKVSDGKYFIVKVE